MLRIFFTVITYICLFLITGSLSAQEGVEQSRSSRNNASFLSLQQREAMDNNLTYSENIYLISNYSGLPSFTPENLSVRELLNRDVEGFYFYLKRDQKNNELLVRNPDGSFSSFQTVLRNIKRTLDSNPGKIITLFLDFYVETEVETAFQETNLSDYLLTYSTRNDWPSIKSMIEQDERLVVFEMQKHLNSPGWLHHLTDYVTGLHESSFEGVKLGQESFDEKLGKSLYLYAGFKNISIPESEEDEILSYTRKTPYLIESYKRA